MISWKMQTAHIECLLKHRQSFMLLPKMGVRITHSYHGVALQNYSEHLNDNCPQSERVTYFKMIIRAVFNTEFESLFAEV